jgi:hypothetical protein
MRFADSARGELVPSVDDNPRREASRPRLVGSLRCLMGSRIDFMADCARD